jgi:hypothetical protein
MSDLETVKVFYAFQVVTEAFQARIRTQHEAWIHSAEVDALVHYSG